MNLRITLGMIDLTSFFFLFRKKDTPIYPLFPEGWTFFELRITSAEKLGPLLGGKGVFPFSPSLYQKLTWPVV